MKTYEELLKEYRKRQHDTVVDAIATGLTYVDEIAIDTGLLEETGILTELTQSIAEHGILQPLLVRPMPDGTYRLVAGERRWRAARLAGLTSVPVNIRELSDFDAMSVALVENLQREDLNPIEEAEGYRKLSDATGWTQEQIAKRVGRSRPSIANSLRLLSPCSTSSSLSV